MIKLENVNKYFNRRKKNQIHVINNTSLKLENTGLVALLGKSGSGKTTLLNAIGGLDKISNGKIYINGKKITRRSTYFKDKIRNLNIGYIFQDYKLLDNISVFENVAIALKIIGIRDKDEIQKRVNEVLESVNMYRYRNRFAKMLSGGERQRVAIARAIVKNPNIVIADEPTGNLDGKNSLEIMNIIKAISKTKLVVLVTHEVELAKFFATRIMEIKDGIIVKDYENEGVESLNYMLDNSIYLKDLKNIANVNENGININVYSENSISADIKLVIKNGNIYIESKSLKPEIIDENSAVKLVDDHYKKIDRNIFNEKKYNMKHEINQEKKLKYTSIYGFFKSIIIGFKKIYNYSVLKKILLVGFFISAMFIVYSISNLFGVMNIKEDNFISTNKDYLYINKSKIKVDDYLKYEKENEVKYLIPGNSLISFEVKLNDYFQISKETFILQASLVDINEISAKNIIAGRMPKDRNEIVIDEAVLNKAFNTSSMPMGYGKLEYNAVGIYNTNDLIGRYIDFKTIPHKFRIVGVVNLTQPCIYLSKEDFINILNNMPQNDNELFDKMVVMDDEDKVLDYELYVDDITLKKGKYPKNDYEVIVNIARQYEMKLNKEIDIKVNNKKLKVVGYYESKTNKKEYFVNNNTVKYSVITSSKGTTICPKKDKSATIKSFNSIYNTDVIDIYERDKVQYINNRKNVIKSSMIFVSVMLGISLVEIYLMTRSSFLSRIKEIGILRAIGVKRIDIYKMFLRRNFCYNNYFKFTRNYINGYNYKGYNTNTFCRWKLYYGLESHLFKHRNYLYI